MVSSQEVDFEFITDEWIKKIIEDYWAQAKAAYDAAAFAGVVVLCGGLLEGLLAWALTSKEHEAREKFPDAFKYKGGDERPISHWDLTSLIKVTRRLHLHLIGETSFRLLQAVQGFRNFIHPYNVVQGSARPDKRLATISLQTVGEVVRSVRGRLPK